MPPKIVSDVRVEPGSQRPCSATGTPPIYIVLIQNFTVLMNTTNTTSSKLYQEGNYTCVATSKYGSDVKHFVIKGGEKIRYFETTPCRGLQLGEGVASCHLHVPGEIPNNDDAIFFFVFGRGEGGGGGGLKEVYYGICASRELR